MFYLIHSRFCIFFALCHYIFQDRTDSDLWPDSCRTLWYSWGSHTFWTIRIFEDAFRSLKYSQLFSAIRWGSHSALAYNDELFQTVLSYQDIKRHWRVFITWLLHSVTLNKRLFGDQHPAFLGNVNEDGTQPKHNKVEAILQFPTPTYLRKLREFLSLIDSYWRRTPHCTKIT